MTTVALATRIHDPKSDNEVPDIIREITGLQLNKVSDLLGREFEFTASGNRPEDVGWSIVGTVSHVEPPTPRGTFRIWSGGHFIEWRCNEDQKWGSATYVAPPVHLGRRGELRWT